ncbi:Cellulose synthase-like D3 [Hibiscus syriacus]|uniref:Cellulose synthase-like D3 n=1 Tax=Hibiscus syriacus TaxID=106335 RepID=A0A6A2Y2L2_HIBSY|nr:Cellulose synthase-like D3 [Hibiscus syriacus]
MTTKPMATTPIIITIVTLLISLHKSSCSTTTTLSPDNNQDLRVAMEEMQKASYFTFAMLLNMSPLDSKFLANVTFLMSNDWMLSKTVILENEVHTFLQRHSIPSQLIFEHLFFVNNNVRIISPNSCTAGSIRWHGFDVVLSLVSNVTLRTCSNNGGSVAPLTSPVDSLPPLPPPAVPYLIPSLTISWRLHHIRQAAAPGVHNFHGMRKCLN